MKVRNVPLILFCYPFTHKTIFRLFFFNLCRLFPTGSLLNQLIAYYLPFAHLHVYKKKHQVSLPLGFPLHLVNKVLPPTLCHQVCDGALLLSQQLNKCKNCFKSPNLAYRYF